MIPLTRLGGGELYVSCDLIATVEEHHDTVLTLTDGKCLIVVETAAEIVAAIVHHRAEVLAASERMLRSPAARTSARAATVLTLRPGSGQ